MAKAFAVGIKQGKFCIEVADVPGFYVNRCLAPMMAEVGPLFRDGVTPEQLDKAIKSMGMPVGPVTLLDEVGADVGLHVQHTMLADGSMGGRMAGADPGMLQTMVDKGWLGRKTGKGFFVYEKAAPKSSRLGEVLLRPPPRKRPRRGRGAAARPPPRKRPRRGRGAAARPPPPKRPRHGAAATFIRGRPPRNNTGTRARRRRPTRRRSTSSRKRSKRRSLGCRTRRSRTATCRASSTRP